MLQQDIDLDGRRDLSGFAVRVLGLLVRQGKEMRPVLLAPKGRYCRVERQKDSPRAMLPEGKDDARENVYVRSGEEGISMNWLAPVGLTVYLIVFSAVMWDRRRLSRENERLRKAIKRGGCDHHFCYADDYLRKG